MNRAVTCSILALTVTLPAVSQANAGQRPDAGSPRVYSLVLTPAHLDPTRHDTLLPQPDTLGEADGASHYIKAAQTLPPDLDEQQIHSWLKGPLADMPQPQAQQIIQQTQTSLDHAARGAKCKTCNWPPVKPGTMPAHLTECRMLAELMNLRARLQIAQGRFDQAIATTRTTLAMAKHVGEAPTTIQGLTGVAMAAMTLRRVEDLAQIKGAPNLYEAMKALPRPLVDLNVPMSAELNSLESNKRFNVLTRAVMRRHLQSSFDRVRLLMHRQDATVAALQVIEGLRHYAATHDSRLPAKLDHITDIEIPDNPATQQPFPYEFHGTQAVLDVPAPKGGTPRDAVRYQIVVAP